MNFKQIKTKAALYSAGVATAGTGLEPLPPGEEIYDLMPALPVAFPWWQYLFHFLGWVLAAWLLYRIYNWLISEPERVRPVIRQSPEKMAFRAIKRLQLSPVWQNRQMKEICETLVFILKSYLFEKYQIGLGPAATSDEMLQTLVAENSSPELRRKVAQLFDTCDRIKFMGESGDAAAEDLLETLFYLIKAEGWQQ